ncbi:MAG: cadherin-like domain-containing protein, partial [Acidimicrobiia bacterium]|nr:cadherin-like domain-containing protein [Acidimicrobiia bacterium]
TLTSPPATVTITVTPANDAPVARNDSYTATRGVTLTVPPAGVLANDSDADGQALTATLVTGPTAAQGTLTMGSDGRFTFVPNATFTGTATLTYRASDGTATASATLSIRMNAPPTASFILADCSVSAAPCAWNVSADGRNSSDSDGSIVSYAWSWGDGTANGSGSTATHTYVSGGARTLVLTVTDDQGATGTASATMTPAVLTITTGYSSQTGYSAQLRWSGHNSAVAIYRNGSVIEDGSANDVTYTRSNFTKSTVEGVYWVCERGGSARCTNAVTVDIP